MDILSTIKEAKAYLRANFEKGIDCPCCRQFVKLYKRKLNSGMAVTLLRIYNESKGDEEKWIPVKEFLRINKYKNSHDWTLLKHWGLLEEKEHIENNTTKSSGYWKITEKGKEFVMNKISVPNKVHIYNNIVLGFSEDKTTIIESLGKHFNYKELFSNL
jgi:hypothetical protein